MLECKMYARLSKPRFSTLKKLMTCINTLVISFIFISFCSFWCQATTCLLRVTYVVLQILKSGPQHLCCCISCLLLWHQDVSALQHVSSTISPAPIHIDTHTHTHSLLYITSSKGPLCNVLLSWLSHSPGNHGKDDQRKNWHIQTWKLQAGSHGMV